MLENILHYLQREAKVSGVTVFRAIEGCGKSGTHVSSLIDLSLDLPLVIEFFDEKNVAKPILEYFS